jgi:CHASE3 domain sensor protein
MVGIGAMVMAGWIVRSLTLATIVPGAKAMVFNSAVAFVVMGGAFYGLTKGALRRVTVAGVFIGLIGFVTGLQYLLGRDFGIDEIFVRQRLNVDLSGPGRMAPNTAVSWVACGIALVLLSSRKRLWSRTIVLLASVIIAISFLALCGYLTGLRNAYGWGRYSGMAFPACLGFLAAGSSMLWLVLHRRSDAAVKAHGSWPFFSVAGSLIFVVGTISMASSYYQSESNAWVYHTYDVRETLGLLMVDLTSSSGPDRRQYFGKGGADPLGEFEAAARKAVADVDRVAMLTSDNPVQMEAVEKLRQEVRAQLEHLRGDLAEQIRRPVSYERRVEQVAGDVQAAEATRLEIEKMMAEEQRLLKGRIATVEHSARQTRGVIAMAGVLSVVLFWMAILRSRRSERDQALAEGKEHESQQRLELALESGRLGPGTWTG